MHGLFRLPSISHRLASHSSYQTTRSYAFKRSRKEDQIGSLKVGVVGSGSLGDPANLVARTPHSVYLFNCGDGTFRAMSSRGHRFRYVSNVFCTRSDWYAVGGVPSLARAVWDKNSLFPTFHGPPAVENYLDQFAILTDLTPDAALTDKQFNREPFFQDGCLDIEFVDLFPATDSGRLHSHVMAFICRVKKRQGRLNLQKFTDMNLTMENLHDLNQGNDVRTPDGTLLTQEDVRGYSYKGGSFLVLDVPSMDYLHNIESNKQLLEPLREINETHGFDFVSHFTPTDVVDTPQYQKFMRTMRTKMHWALNESNSFWTNKWMHKHQNELNAVDCEVFPKLCSTYDTSPRTYMSTGVEFPAAGQHAAMEPTSSGTKYIFQFNPRKAYSREAEEVDDEEEDSDDDTSEEEILSKPAQVLNANRPNEYPKIVIFGTGSSFPGVLKTATGILVHTSPDAAILLDCGEGTAGQIIRFYGDHSERVFQKIKAVFISHMHGDHHCGLMEFLRMREKFMPGDRPRMVLMAPMENFAPLLEFYEQNFGNVLSHFDGIDNSKLITGELSDDQKTRLNITGLNTCTVKHIDNSFAISLRMKRLPAIDSAADFKLTFSGDTMPCDELVQLGKNSNLLIHEATLEDSLTNSARFKNHSTISQGIAQGKNMAADYTLLTHFSQRYRVLPPIPDELMTKDVSIAMDYMEIVPSDLPKLNDVYYTMKETFRDELGRVERRSQRYKELDDMRKEWQ